jgi:AcrR family transcriptional regulator
MVEEGLRERSKARRRAAVTRAAFELFAERGYDATTVADIAARAEVAPRTVAMYFRSKQDMALSRFGEAADRLTDALRDRRPGESALDILGRWLRTENAIPDDGNDELEHRMFDANPQLSALRNARLAAAVHEATKAVAHDLEVAPDSLGPRIAAAAAAAVIMELANGPRDFGTEEDIATALGFIEAGIKSLGPTAARETGERSL